MYLFTGLFLAALTALLYCYAYRGFTIIRDFVLQQRRRFSFGLKP
jgi:hypothetical protein